MELAGNIPPPYCVRRSRSDVLGVGFGSPVWIPSLQMVVKVTRDGYEVEVDGRYFCSYEHRSMFKDLKAIKFIELGGDLVDAWMHVPSYYLLS